MLLYNRGWSGTNIDLNPTSIDLFNISRKRDKNVVACLSNKEEKLNIYFDNILSPLNSNYRNNLKNFKIQNYKKIKTKAQIFSKIIKKKFDFLNIDCEGSDFKILKSIDLNFYRPKLICVEVLSKNKKKIYRYLNQFNYKVLKVKKISHIFVRSTNI